MTNDKIFQILHFSCNYAQAFYLLYILCITEFVYFCQRLIVWKYKFAYIFSSVVFMSLTKLMKLKFKEMKSACVTKFLHHYL